MAINDHMTSGVGIPRFSIRGLLQVGRGEGLRAHLVRGVMGTGSIGVVHKALGLLVAIFLARNLGTEGYGYYAFAIAMIGFIAIPAQLGMPSLVMRQIAASHAKQEWSIMRGLSRWSLSIALAVVVAGAVGLGGGLLFLSDRIAALDPPTFAVALLLLPLLVVNSMMGSQLAGLRHVVHALWPGSVLQPALYLLLLVALLRMASPERAIVLNIVSTAVGTAIVWHLLRGKWPEEARRAAPVYQVETWFRSLLPFTLLGGIELLNQRTDIGMLGVLTSAADVGVYNVATQGAALVAFPLVAVNAVLGPNVARLHAQGNSAQLQRLMTISTIATTALSGVAALVLFVWGRWLLDNIFGNPFAAGYGALAFLVVGQMVNAAMGSVGLFLSMTGNERDTLTAITFSATLNVLLNGLLIPYFGIAGAAAATAISTICWNVTMGIMVYRRLGIVPGPIYGAPRYAKIRRTTA